MLSKLAKSIPLVFAATTVDAIAIKEDGKDIPVSVSSPSPKSDYTHDSMDLGKASTVIAWSTQVDIPDNTSNVTVLSQASDDPNGLKRSAEAVGWGAKVVGEHVGNEVADFAKDVGRTAGAVGWGAGVVGEHYANEAVDFAKGVRDHFDSDTVKDWASTLTAAAEIGSKMAELLDNAKMKKLGKLL